MRKAKAKIKRQGKEGAKVLSKEEQGKEQGSSPLSDTRLAWTDSQDHTEVCPHLDQAWAHFEHASLSLMLLCGRR